MNGSADRIRGQMINGLLVVKATIAGLHLRMIADTGAALTIITPENAEKIATFAPAVRPRWFAFLGATREMNLLTFEFDTSSLVLRPIPSKSR